MEELVFSSNGSFNILHWLKVNNVKFPTLARMACDILSVQDSIVASDVTFSVSGRVIDETCFINSGYCGGLDQWQ